MPLYKGRVERQSAAGPDVIALAFTVHGPDDQVAIEKVTAPWSQHPRHYIYRNPPP